jgi:hypothetical protein
MATRLIFQARIALVVVVAAIAMGGCDRTAVWEGATEERNGGNSLSVTAAEDEPPPGSLPSGDGGGSIELVASTGRAPVAGVTAVRSGAPQIWMLEDEPLISIGAEASGPTSDLFRANAVLLSDGVIAIADGGMRLMYFESDGTHIRTVGRRGRGPGEFERITWLQRLPGDTVVVGDEFPGGRVSFFTRDGEFVRMAPMPEQWAATFGVFDDGTIFGGKRHVGAATRTGAVSRGDIDLLRFDQTGAVADSFATAPYLTFVRVEGGLVQTTLLPQTSAAVRGRRAYVTTGERLEVQVYEADRGYLFTFSAPYEPKPLPRSEIVRAFAESRFAESVTDRTLHNLPENPTSGVSDLVKVDELGNVWVRELWREREVPSNWWIFDADGRQVATANMPPRFWPHHITADRVVGVQRDELDIERVHILRLVKPAP